MDGLFALDSWDVDVEVLHSSNNRKSKHKGQRETAREIPTPSLRRKVARVLRTAEGIKNWIRVMLHPEAGNWRCGVVNLQAQPTLGNWSEVRSSTSESQKMEFHKMNISDHRDLEKVFNNMREKVNRAEEAPVIGTEALKTNVLICGLLMSTTMKAAIHLQPNYKENLEVYKSTNFEELQNLFDISQKLILEHEAEILKVSPIDWTARSWTRSKITHDQVITWTKAKVHVYSDSVSCLGKKSEHSEANQRWKNQVEEYRQSNSYRELLGIDGEPIEFEWNVFPRRTSLEILQKIQKDLQDRSIDPGHFEDRIIFMSMFNDIDWTKRRNPDAFQIPNTSRITWRDSREDNGHFSAMETSGSGTELSVTHLKEDRIPSRHRLWNDWKKPVSIEIPYTAMRMLRAQNSYFARFTQQISRK